MDEKQRNALNVLLKNGFGFGFDALADNEIDIVNALIDKAYADTLQGVVEVDPAAREEAEANVKTLIDEMLNNKIDFEREGLDTWLGCLYREIVKYYKDAGLTDENPMTTDLSKKWVTAFLDDLTTVVDVASLDKDLKSSYSFNYYQEVVDTFRDCFPKPEAG